MEPGNSNAYQLLPPTTLAVTERLGVPKVRKIVRLSNLSPDIEIAPFNENLATLRRAVAERVFLVKGKDGGFTSPPKPAPKHFENELAPIRDLLRPFLPSTAPMSFASTLATFKGCKKKRYEQAYSDLMFTRTRIEDEAKVTVFVKYEKTDRTSKKDPVPRVISPRSPMFNLRLARYLRKVEERIYDALGKLFGHKTVMKGITTTQTAKYIEEKWNMFNDPVAVGLDASRFDQHVSRAALEFEHSIYLLCFKHGKHQRKLAGLLRRQLENHCSGHTPDGSVKYTTDGTRMSGDMNTSLGNCVLMCMMLKAYALHCGVAFQLANNGDDCVVFLERKDLVKFSTGLDAWFLRLGFNMVVEDPSYALEEIEFCQTRPVFDGSEWVMCRNPWTAIAKDCVLAKNPQGVSDTYLKSWMGAVGTGGMSLTGGMPVFQSFYGMMQRSGQGARRARKNRSGSRGRVSKHDVSAMLPWYMRNVGGGQRQAGDISPECRASFYFAFGVTPDEQVELEKFYDGQVVVTEYGEWHPRALFPSRI